jgi:hypothetical protein
MAVPVAAWGAHQGGVAWNTGLDVDNNLRINTVDVSRYGMAPRHLLVLGYCQDSSQRRGP